ncbi:MAG: hypothetical protein ACE5KG_07555 [Nitrososphaerales archaeon]
MLKSVLITTIIILLALPITSVTGHGTGGTTKEVGDYLVRFRAFPPVPNSDEETVFFFSIEDQNFQHISNVTTSISLLRGNELVKAFPRELQRIGDFGYKVVLPREGAYKVVLFIHEGTADPPLQVEFRVRSSDGLLGPGTINTIVPFLVIILAGLVLFKIFRDKKGRKVVK